MSSAHRDRTAWVERVVAERCFGLGAAPSAGPLTFGAELELLAVREDDRSVAKIVSVDESRGTLDVVRGAGSSLGWRETQSDKGVPRFVSREGGALTFEPGGQLEYASAVHQSVDGVLQELQHVERVLRDHAADAGITLLALGVDPYNGASEVPLQLTQERYARMARHFAHIGPDGARMMRQTASLQLNVGGIPSLERFALANALAPILTALFANSRLYAGEDTGCASYRAMTWRGVDPSRTGVFEGADPVREYARFALGASAFLADERAPAFADLADDLATDDALATHLTTLFPEVRPRGYLELRSLDAVGHPARAAALALVAGVLGHDEGARSARALLRSANEDDLRDAARRGRSSIHETQLDALIDIAARGCASLGPAIVSEEAVAAMRALAQAAVSTPA